MYDKRVCRACGIEGEKAFWSFVKRRPSVGHLDFDGNRTERVGAFATIWTNARLDGTVRAHGTRVKVPLFLRSFRLFFDKTLFFWTTDRVAMSDRRFSVGRRRDARAAVTSYVCRKNHVQKRVSFPFEL